MLPPMNSRHTPRLKDYDYTQPGIYFITIYTENRECIFGDVVGEIMQQNTCGEIVANDWLSLPTHYKYTSVADFVVMPNHFHGIVELLENADQSLINIIRAFKSGVGRRINVVRETPGQTVWQRSFYDCLVRNEDELIRIRQYIADNPLRWALDSENPANKHS